MDTIGKKLEHLIKQKITELKLVKTGRMLNSIEVIETEDSFVIKSVDYFPYLDEKYKITESVLNSLEFSNYIDYYYETILMRDINNQIDSIF